MLPAGSALERLEHPEGGACRWRSRKRVTLFPLCPHARYKELQVALVRQVSCALSSDLPIYHTS